MTKIISCDLSLNHSGFVEFTNGEMTNFWYFTNNVGSADRSKNHATRLPKFKGDKQTRAMMRLMWIKKFLKEKIVSAKPSLSIGIEDYAFGAAQGAHQIGEIGGIARLLFFENGIPMRYCDPKSVKMFTTHNGAAKKEEMEAAVKNRWGVDFSEYNPPPNKKTGKVNRQTSEDLSDAYAIAKLVWTELQLRRGEIILRDLHEKEIRVFNRVTKANKVGLLDRDWIERN